MYVGNITRAPLLLLRIPSLPDKRFRLRSKASFYEVSSREIVVASYKTSFDVFAMDHGEEMLVNLEGIDIGSIGFR